MIGSIFRFSFFLSPLAFILSLPSCQQAHGETPIQEEIISNVQEIQAVPVSVQKAVREAFPLKTLVTGKLEAGRQAEIKFLRGGQLTVLSAREGEFIEEGQLLAKVDDSAPQLKLEQSKLTLDEAIVNKKDLLIANGGNPESDSSVSEQKLGLILTLSGYNKAQHHIRQAAYELQQTKVYAPFNGIIADVKAKKFQQVNAGEIICTLIDPRSYEVSLSVLEKEALQLSIGQSVIVEPIAAPNQKHSAQITTINPTVNEQGLVRVRAALRNYSGKKLFEGMNVNVTIEKKLPQKLIIPKNALVIRSGREVVFTFREESGKAQWHYVQSSYENDEFIVIEKGLEEESLVIYDGNQHLVDGAKVSVVHAQ